MLGLVTLAVPSAAASPVRRGPPLPLRGGPRQAPPLPLLTTHYSPLATLLTTHYSLLATHYSLLTTHYTTHYSLLTTHYSLLTTHYSLLTTHYSLLTTLEAAHPFFLTAAEARQLATEEGLTLETTAGGTGFAGVKQVRGGRFMGRVGVGKSRRRSIGSIFTCAEGAALAIARKTKASVEMKEKSAADALEAAPTESSSTPVEALGCDMLLPVARAEAAALPQRKDSSGTSTPSAVGHLGSSRPRGSAGAMEHGAMFTTHYSLLTTHYTTHYSLLATHYSLLTTHYSPLAILLTITRVDDDPLLAKH